jgi:hypothetical protein
MRLGAREITRKARSDKPATVSGSFLVTAACVPAALREPNA